MQLGGTSTASGTNVQINLNATSTAASGTLTIANGATFNDRPGQRIEHLATDFGGGNGATATVNNEGTFIKSGSATTSQISTLFNDTGIVNVEAGTLDLSNGGTDVGATYEGAGTIQLAVAADAGLGVSITTANAIFSGGIPLIMGPITSPGRRRSMAASQTCLEP